MELLLSLGMLSPKEALLSFITVFLDAHLVRACAAAFIYFHVYRRENISILMLIDDYI